METRNGKGLPGADPETFVPESSGVVRISGPAMWDFMREDAGEPPPPPDPQRGAITNGRDITAAFTELVREGKSCAYALLQRATQQAFPYIWTGQNWSAPWKLFAKERDGLGVSFNGDGGGGVYTATLKRALRTWVAVVRRPYTDEEAHANALRFGDSPKTPTDLLKSTSVEYQLHCKKRGIEDPKGDGLRKFRVEHFALPDMTDAQLLKHFEDRPLPRWFRNEVTCDQVPVDGPNETNLPEGTRIIPTSAEVSTDERHRRWIAEFAAEVEVCIERFKDREELPHELERLIAEVEAFEVGQGEAKAFVEHLQSTAAGRDVLRKMADVKARLLQRLQVFTASLPGATPSTAAVVGSERLPWESSTNAFAYIFTTLSARGYFPMPRKGGKLNEPNFTAFARVLLQAFDLKGEDGESLTPEQLRVRLTDAAPRPLAETKKAKFQIPDKGELIVPNAEELEDKAR